MSQERFPSLDGLRTLACLGIVAMHVKTNLPNQPSNIPFFSNVIDSAGNFVLLFMMVSAFSLCCGYLQRFRDGSISLENFYTRRYKRILPFFALLTIIDVLVCLAQNHFAFSKTVAYELWEAFANLTLLFGLLPGNDISVIGVGWFIGVIFFFYLLFPFYSTLLSSKKKAWLALAVAMIWNVAIRNYFVPVQGASAGETCMLVVAPFFLVAGIVYLYKDFLKNLMSKKWSNYLFKVLVIIVSLLFFLFPNIRFLYSNLLLYTLWLIYAIIEDPTKKSFLSNPVMKFISTISLEIYLCHMMFFRIIEKVHMEKFTNNPDVIYYTTLLLVLLGAIVFSLIWKKFEKRFIK